MSCPCCNPPFCCQNTTLPPFLAFTISSFTTGRGDFLDFDPNQTFLFGFPEININLVNGTQTTLVNKCVCYNSLKVIQDETFQNDANNPCVPGVPRQTSGAAYSTLYDLAIGTTLDFSSFSTECRQSSAVSSATGNMSLAGYMNSRTTSFPNQVSHVRFAGTGYNNVDLGITRQGFINALCDRTLSLSGSAAVNFTELVFFACQPFGAAITFDWTLSISQAI